MKEATIAGVISGIIVMAAFAGGVWYGKNEAVVQTCHEGTLYVGFGPTDDMVLAQVVYPLDKVQCKTA